MQKLILASFAALALSGTAFAQDAAPATPAPTAAPEQPVAAEPAGLDEAGFYIYQEGRQMLGSRLIGADVWGAENESIGNVDDLLIDENGDVIAIVVGIGGFLGIGTRDVAISTDQLDFILLQDAAPPAGAAPADPAAPAAPPAAAPAAPGAVPPGQPGAGWGWTGAGIDRIQVNYTRAQLETAPEFTYAE
jgi:pyruvate/2-oxoglutarate dehydrogenase complex dihydrolipoamide acyltransferase (E2) component